MNWEFKPAEPTPDIRRGGMECYVILVLGDNGRHFVTPAHYLNGYPLEHDPCICAVEEDHDDGCPTFGWFSDESNYDYEHCYHPIRGKVVAYAELPSAETALALMSGSPW